MHNLLILKQILVAGLLLLAAFSMSRCKSDDGVVPDEEPPFANYIQVGKEYYSLGEALAIYDNSTSNTAFTIYLTDAVTDNGITFDFLLVNKTTQLPDGTFNFKKVNHSSQMELNRFHTTLLKYGAVTSKTQVTSFDTDFSQALLYVKKQNGKYVLDAEFEYNGQKAKVHYEGTLEHMEAW